MGEQIQVSFLIDNPLVAGILCLLMRLLIPLLALGLLVGCASDPSVKHGRHGSIAYQIHVEASEPGTKIEWNNEYMGVAPCDVEVFGDKNGQFMNLGTAYGVLRALPSIQGQYTQRKAFYFGFSEGKSGDHIPKQVFFEMSLVPQKPSVDVNFKDQH